MNKYFVFINLFIVAQTITSKDTLQSVSAITTQLKEGKKVTASDFRTLEKGIDEYHRMVDQKISSELVKSFEKVLEGYVANTIERSKNNEMSNEEIKLLDKIIENKVYHYLYGGREALERMHLTLNDQMPGKAMTILQYKMTQEERISSNFDYCIANQATFENIQQVLQLLQNEMEQCKETDSKRFYPSKRIHVVEYNMDRLKMAQDRKQEYQIDKYLTEGKMQQGTGELDSIAALLNQTGKNLSHYDLIHIVYEFPCKKLSNRHNIQQFKKLIIDKASSDNIQERMEGLESSIERSDFQDSDSYNAVCYRLKAALLQQAHSEQAQQKVQSRSAESVQK